MTPHAFRRTDHETGLFVSRAGEASVEHLGDQEATDKLVNLLGIDRGKTVYFMAEQDGGSFALGAVLTKKEYDMLCMLIDEAEIARPIAALYVQTGGSYFNVESVIPIDVDADARMYMGPHPVVAHPPCERWGKMWKGQPGNIKRGKVERMGDDKGCFKSALFDVRRFGGVLEHPEHSNAWRVFGLAKPPRKGGWVKADEFGGWTCRVEQGQYGHYCPKPTWLYAVGVDPLPELRWGVHPVTDDMFPRDALRRHGIEYCRKAGLMAFMGGGRNSTVRIQTPVEFRDILIAMARTVNGT